MLLRRWIARFRGVVARDIDANCDAPVTPDRLFGRPAALFPTVVIADLMARSVLRKTDAEGRNMGYELTEFMR